MAEVPVPSAQIEPDEPIMDLDPDAAALEVDDKIELLKGFESDLSAATYCLHNEDHTIGNALRFMLMKNPSVEFCGYSNPHPSEPKIHIRIQMYDRKSSLVALREALDNLEQLFETIGRAYEKDLEADAFEHFVEPGLTEEQMRETVAKGEEMKRARQEERTATDAARIASTAKAS